MRQESYEVTARQPTGLVPRRADGPKEGHFCFQPSPWFYLALYGTSFSIPRLLPFFLPWCPALLTAPSDLTVPYDFHISQSYWTSLPWGISGPLYWLFFSPSFFPPPLLQHLSSQGPECPELIEEPNLGKVCVNKNHLSLLKISGSLTIP